MTESITTSEPAPAPSPAIDFDPVPALAVELGLAPGSVAAVVALLGEGNTVPFIARYRKERTGGLDEVQIRAIEERRAYIMELEERRAAVLASIREQGKLTPELEAKIVAAQAKSELEDLYAPYRPKRRTRATIAREKGLGPLADKILAQAADGDPVVEAAAFVAGEVASVEDALSGARDIAAEVVAETAEVRAWVRRELAEEGELVSDVAPGKADEPTKFQQYYAFREKVKTIPSHRFLAIRRGEAEGVLRAHVAVDADKIRGGIERLAKVAAESPWATLLREAVADAFKRLLAPSVENDVRTELKLRSDIAAVDVFADNLKNLLLAAPLGARAVVGVDPGLRTGCKIAAVDATGKFLDTITVFISQGDAQLAVARESARAFFAKHTPIAIAVGNGTGGREAEAFVRKLLVEAGAAGMYTVQVSEAGASVYSASEVAREEFPDLDLTIRGAISIARRLQDPLAELVKIEPKAIGVGQYQHDVHQPLLAKKLGDVVESCVNHVGVELNTASAALLQYVAGIGKSLAKKIVVWRDEHGAFSSRKQLLDVPGLGPKAFEQAAGFLRIRGAAQALDASAVHPERYALVEQMAADLGVEVAALFRHAELVDKIELDKYVSEGVGRPTLLDIAAELKKPGRDPREEFSPPKFRDDVVSLEDLKPGMSLEGVVTNVTAFGAFVDIGVHNDGLVHVSQLSDKFVKDPTEVVKAGQKIQVRVLEVDLVRKRIALSARPEGQRQQQQQRGGGGGGDRRDQQPRGDQRRDRGPRPQQQQGRGPGQGQGQGQGQRPPQGQPQGQGPGPGQQQQREWRGPRRDDRRDDRGPRPQQGQQGQGPGQAQAQAQPQRQREDAAPAGGRGDRMGPRRDDRSERREEPPQDPKGQGIGVGGFVNNPFAKLGELKKS